MNKSNMNKRKRVSFFMGLIICGTMVTGGCSGDEVATEENTTTIVENTTSNEVTSKEETTTEEPITEEVTQPTTEEPTTVIEDVYEDFEGYKIKKLNCKMVTTARMNIRKGPRESYQRVGGLDINQEVKVTGYCETTGWYRVEHGGIVGYVTGLYLVEVEEETYKLVLGDECPYPMLVKTNYSGQKGWFYRTEGNDKPDNYEDILKMIKDEGYTIENEPIYVGTWRDVGDVMWIGYSK